MMTGVSPVEHRILDFTRFAPSSGQKEPITSDERRAPAIWNMAGLRRPDQRDLRPVGDLPRRARQRPPRLRPAHGLPLRREGPAAGHRLPRRARGLGARDAEAVEEATGYAAAPRLPALALRGRVPADRERAEGRSLRAPGRRAAADPDRDARSTTASRPSGSPEKRPDLADRLLPGHGQHRPHVRAVRAAAAGRRSPTRTTRATTRCRALLPARRRDARAPTATSPRSGAPCSCSRPTTASSGRRAGRSSCRASRSRPPARWHRKDGIYLLWGPGVAPAPGHPHRGGAAQVCSTLLALLGLPRGLGLAEPVLPGIVAPAGKAVDYAAHYRPAAPVATAAGGDAEAVEKLKALGYIGAGEATSAPAGASGTRTAGSYNNEGLVLRAGGQVRRPPRPPSRRRSRWTRTSAPRCGT